MRPAALLALLALPSACSYDLDVLKGRRVDGGFDAAVDTPTDTVVDRAQPDVVADVPRDMPATDVGPSRDASVGACNIPGVTVMNAPAPTNGVTVITGDTSGGGTTTLSLCQSMISANSTRVYRYEVQAGPRLLATTNTGLCGGHDTVLAAFFSCEGMGRAVGSANCNDDDMVNLCGACSDAGVGGGCGAENSTLDLSGLVAHDVIYFTVASYGSMHAPFRLAIAENGLAPQPAPTGIAGETPANRCACPPATGVMTGEIPFPRTGDTNQFSTASRQVLGGRDLPFTRVTGVSARLALSRYNVDTSGPCAVTDGARAALDLLVNNTVVATGKLGIGSGSGGFITIPLTTFAPVVIPMPTGIPLTYRLRNVEPAGVACVSLDVDLTASNIVTLYGTN